MYVHFFQLKVRFNRKTPKYSELRVDGIVKSRIMLYLPEIILNSQKKRLPYFLRGDMKNQIITEC